MSEPTTEIHTVRPDIDIQGDLQDLLVRYPPLAHDRHRLTHSIQQGHLTMAGWVRSRTTYSYLISNLPLIPGIAAVDHSQLYNDDDIRTEIGQMIPFGVFANLEYGIVKLTGSLPDGTTVETLVEKIAAVRGVQRVITVLQ